MNPMVWKLIGTGAAVGAGALANAVTKGGWKFLTGSNPPDNPEDPDVGWKEAVLWALASGAVIGIARLLAERQAAAYYRKAVGTRPPGLRGGGR
ncbi:uncharacterized protein DUF4235 [Kineococcus xinjiangensis]|uniref:Uncharacterized protein DUF4235 n=1 Tax=Kineococcus xinjiangensis TaxID=512762 RepID=A0A2S6IUS7_9ACTN|nr:DUF4235 domain-containing protein [Kineococcus xinjiangensis]PPK98021.1 uncharacterized protein DUF4235 [Kineococcus xinjiangensis]